MPKTILLASLSILLVVSIIVQPDASFKASLQGLTIWWNIVFPGLLPFLILYEMIRAFGLAHAISALLQPLMRPLLRLPGEAGLALVHGWVGGFPAGSEATAALRKRELVSKAQGQRLLAYSHMPNPLFMLVVVGAGFLHRPLAGLLIAAAVWLSAVWVLLLDSLLFRRSSVSAVDAENKGLTAVKTDTVDIAAKAAEARPQRLLQAAAAAMRTGREQDGRSLGKVLGDAVSASVQKLMLVGGFMIFAAVLSRLCEPLFVPLLEAGLPFIGPALFESHLGSYAAAVWQHPGASWVVGAAAIAAILAFSGMSGILLAGYSASGTDLRLLPFIRHRIMHALHAFLFTLLLWPVVQQAAAMLSPDGILPSLAGKEGAYGPSFVPIAQPITADGLPALWNPSLVLSLFFGAALLIIYLVIRLRAPKRTSRRM